MSATHRTIRSNLNDTPRNLEPQISEEPFRFVDNGVKGGAPGGLWYRVRVVDAEGAKADSNTVLPPQAVRLSG